MKRPDLIEAQLQKTSLKKLGLNPIHLAEIYYDFKQYDKAAQFLIQVKDPGYFSFVADLFKNMKNNELPFNKTNFINLKKERDMLKITLQYFTQENENLKNELNDMKITAKKNKDMLKEYVYQITNKDKLFEKSFQQNSENFCYLQFSFIDYLLDYRNKFI